MSWTEVPTKVDGDPITEAMWDQLRDLVNEDMVVKLDSNALGSDQASITFSNIPQTHRNLLLIYDNGRSTQAITMVGYSMRFNGDSGANYDNQTIGGVGGAAGGQTVEAFAQTGHAFGMLIPGSSAGSAFCGQGHLRILEYSSTSKHKIVHDRCGGSYQNTTGGHYTRITTSRWRSTAAITSITVLASANNITSGTRFTLYGEN
jgi:hypothetical protein